MRQRQHQGQMVPHQLQMTCHDMSGKSGFLRKNICHVSYLPWWAFHPFSKPSEQTISVHLGTSWRSRRRSTGCCPACTPRPDATTPWAHSGQDLTIQTWSNLEKTWALQVQRTTVYVYIYKYVYVFYVKMKEYRIINAHSKKYEHYWKKLKPGTTNH